MDEFNLDFLEESNKKVLSDLAPTPKAEIVKEFLPIAYQIVKKQKAGELKKVVIDTYLVKQGYFEMAKGLAVKKAKYTGHCVVYEILKVCEKVNGRLITKEIERFVIEVGERIEASKTIMYKSGHKRTRGRA